MSLKHLRALFLLLFAFTTPLWSQSVQYENQPIERIDIEVEGTSGEDLNVNLIKSRINTREGDFFSQSEFDNDLKRLVLEFDRIEPSLDSVNGKMIITLKVWPKPTIRTIRWEGRGREDLTALQKELGVTPGTPFDRQGFNRAFHKVKAYYIKKGYFEAEMFYDVMPADECNEVDIIITINAGRAGKIDQIRFNGITSCEESEILDIMMTKEYFFFTYWLSSEGIYNEDMVQQDQMNIINYFHDLGYADAKVKVEVDESCDRNSINLSINVDKGPLYYFGGIEFSGKPFFAMRSFGASLLSGKAKLILLQKSERPFKELPIFTEEEVSSTAWLTSTFHCLTMNVATQPKLRSRKAPNIASALLRYSVTVPQKQR